MLVIASLSTLLLATAPATEQLSTSSSPFTRLLETLGVLVLVTWFFRWFKFVKIGLKAITMGFNIFRWDVNLRKLLRIHRRRQRQLIRTISHYASRNKKMIKIALYFIFSEQGRYRMIKLQYNLRHYTWTVQTRHHDLLHSPSHLLDDEQRKRLEDSRKAVLLHLDSLDRQLSLLSNIRAISQTVAQPQTQAKRVGRAWSKLKAKRYRRRQSTPA